MAKAAAASSSRKRKGAAAAAKPPRVQKTKKSVARVGRRPPKPIELYYWPTPNGWKISIMLEECGLPYVMKPVAIGKGEQFKPQFLKISPNNRIPAIVDPAGPGGRPISVFESGAILQYLGRKTGKFYPADERKRVQVEEWLYWQMGGLGPMAGQANHFLNYTKEGSEYARKRYTDEVNRLFGVIDTRLAGRKFLADDYSIADMACLGWVLAGVRTGQNLDDFPHLKNWVERLRARPAVQRGLALGRELREAQANDPNAQEEARKILFGQRARPAAG
jgi:glutathione S-transferase